MKSFEAHGRFRINLVDRVFCLEIRDSWNMQGLEAYMAEFRSVSAQLVDGKPWASLVDVTSATLSTPDTIAPFNMAAKDVTRSGRTHLAVIGAQKEIERWHMDAMFESAGVTLRHVADVPAAWDWLASLEFCRAAPPISLFDG